MTGHDHERHMLRAIALTAHVPDRPFAAVIVDSVTDRILAEGWNKSDYNPILHGEIDAINSLVASVAQIEDRRLVLYSTAEPCPMCQGAILWTGIETVVFGTSIRFLSDLGWRQIEIPADEVARRSSGLRCNVVGGVLETECNRLFRPKRSLDQPR